MTPSTTPARAITHWLRHLDRMLRAITATASILVLPISLLLFLQWPLRDLGLGYSREANDLAQWLFALYVSVAVSYATRRRTHLAADALAQRYAPRTRRHLERAAAAAVLVPWSAFVLYAGWPMAMRSLAPLERFPDTDNPGYFLIPAGMWLLALLVLLQALLDVTREQPPS